MQSKPHVTASAGATSQQLYRPISDYGIIGDCRTAALIGPDGSIDWCCLPHFDSPAIFCKVLDAHKGGSFRVGPVAHAETSMAYLPGTNVLETTFQTTTGRARLVDFMPIRHRHRSRSAIDAIENVMDRLTHNGMREIERELGNDVATAHRIDRILTCLEGEMEIEVVLHATFDYARKPSQTEVVIANEDILGATVHADDRFLAFYMAHLPAGAQPVPGTALTLAQSNGALTVRTTLHAGNGLVCAVNYARSASEATDALHHMRQHDFTADLQETRSYWLDWSARSRYTGTYQDEVIRSALALKLCTFEPTGAIIAAPTTSLPEDIGGVRNWDYRYTWLRDSAFTLAALGSLGYYDEARDYFHFLHDLQIQSGDDIRIMYGIRGESGSQLREQELTHLEGYRGSRPVRIGNGAAEQRQLDVYGELLDAASAYLRHEGFRHDHTSRLSARDLTTFSALIADYVCAHWQDLDRGIWEVRGDPRPFVYSRVMCWVALDRAIALAHLHGQQRHVERWSRARDTIARDVLSHGYDEKLASFVQSYGSTVLDASNLRLPLVGFLPWGDSRIRSTVAATDSVLTAQRGLLFRYQVDGGQGNANAQVDGLPGHEGAFVACTLWLVDCLCHLGKIEEARERFEQLLASAGPLGLFAEELDPGTGAQLGNYPQAFTHIGVINSAINLLHAQEGTLRTDGEPRST